MRRQLHILSDLAVVDAVVGYRLWEAWTVDGVVHLSSVAKREIRWPQGQPLKAECLCYSRAKFGQVVGYPHSCGIYAWREPIIPRTQTTLDTQPLGVIRPSVYIAGEVLLWGDPVHVHERGYRGAWALPSAFYVVDGMSGRLMTTIGLAAIQFSAPIVKVDTAEYKREHPNEGIEALIRVRAWLDPAGVRSVSSRYPVDIPDSRGRG